MIVSYSSLWLLVRRGARRKFVYSDVSSHISCCLLLCGQHNPNVLTLDIMYCGRHVSGNLITSFMWWFIVIFSFHWTLSWEVIFICCHHLHLFHILRFSKFSLYISISFIITVMGILGILYLDHCVSISTTLCYRIIDFENVKCCVGGEVWTLRRWQTFEDFWQLGPE